MKIHQNKLPREVIIISPHCQKPLPHKLMGYQDFHSNLKVPPMKVSPQVIQDTSQVQPPQQNLPMPTLDSAPHLSSNQTTSHHNHSSRLPKLNLPTFSGNPLRWFTFWDSFEAAVHSNTSLRGVQKFTYLKVQLMGDALRAVTGFPLTNSNYEQAVTLLREHFGQPNK